MNYEILNTFVSKQFKRYKDDVAEAGYELVHQSPGSYNLLIVRIRNGIKVEIRHKKYKGKFYPIILAAYGHKQLDLVKQWFEENGYELPETTHALNNCVNTKFVTIENFIDVCKKLEDIDGLVATVRGRGWNNEKAFLSCAASMKAHLDNECPRFITRDMFDMMDSLVSVNQPLQENSYREHVVPITMIIDESIRMFEDNQSIEDVAQMIEDNLKIVHITKDQAKHLDIDLGLRTSMPSGWAFGDNIFARLDEAGINY